MTPVIFKSKKVLFLILAMIIIIIGIFVLYEPKSASAPIKLPANLTAPAVSIVSTEPGWQTFTDPNQSITFQYPENLGTTYISTVGWPPKAKVLDTAFKCQPAGQAILPAGRTDIEKINGSTYCVTIESEGAAGSVYNQYAYAFEKSGKEVILSFTLQEVQCDNYPEPQASECKTERASFNIGNIVDRMASTVKL
jgi:hypothetical protein